MPLPPTTDSETDIASSRIIEISRGPGETKDAFSPRAAAKRADEANRTLGVIEPSGESRLHRETMTNRVHEDRCSMGRHPMKPGRRVGHYTRLLHQTLVTAPHLVRGTGELDVVRRSEHARPRDERTHALFALEYFPG